MSFIGASFKSAQLMMDPAMFRQVDALSRSARSSAGKETKLNKAVNDFEALFVNNMLKTMRSTIQKSGLFGDGMREDIYTSLFDWEISKEMAAGGGLGLGRILLREFNGPGPNEGGAGGTGAGGVEKKDGKDNKKTKVFLSTTEK